MALFALFDPMYLIIVGPTILLALYAQYKVKSAYARYSRIGTARRTTGAQAARDVLASAGIPTTRVSRTDGDDLGNAVRIELTQGWLSDHYDPRTRTLRLSPGVYQSTSIAAVGIAAHEAGHAIQHAAGYSLMRLRSFMVPAASLGSWLAFPIILIGFFFRMAGLVNLGIILFGTLVVFQLITLPVEFNASSRARAALSTGGIISTDDEARGVARVLNAAAMTYVAATITALAQLLYFIMLFSGRRD